MIYCDLENAQEREAKTNRGCRNKNYLRIAAFSIIIVMASWILSARVCIPRTVISRVIYHARDSCIHAHRDSLQSERN